MRIMTEPGRVAPVGAAKATRSANRKNKCWKQATGHRTEQGKLMSSYNSVTHGARIKKIPPLPGIPA
jgi:hypothetical protein